MNYQAVPKLIVVLLAVSGLSSALGWWQKTPPPELLSAPPAEETVSSTPTTPDPFSTVALKAKAAIVLDPQTGEIIFAKNITTALPLASLTKVMTALVASDLIPLPDATLVTIKTEDISAEGDSGLKPGDEWHVKDLINFSLLTSSNDGAKALASAAAVLAKKDFVREMNQRAGTLGLKDTTFRNETGLDLVAGIEGGAYGSAEDVARLFAYVYQTKPELFLTTNQATAVLTPLNDGPYHPTNTNPVATKIPGLIASKTGYTDLSGGNLAVIFDRGLNQPAVAVVLGSTQEERFSDMLALVQATITNLVFRLEHPSF